jgi:mannose-6-phosphate isomerase-like protein (cupin superfamily)
MDTVLSVARELCATHGLRVVGQDLERPWGGFIVLSDADAALFARLFFPSLPAVASISPKFLMIAPGKRLSLQYHLRRSEQWRILRSVSAFVGEETATYEKGALVIVGAGVHHRLIGGEEWGLVAEAWVHEDTSRPSDEDDIVRVQDDYGRQQK